MSALFGRSKSSSSRSLAGMSAIALILGFAGYFAAPAAASSADKLDFKAARPASYTAVYPPVTCPAGGRANAPMAGAQYSNGVESLMPSDLYLGQIVPFELRIKEPSTATMTVNFQFDTRAQNGADFGFDPAYGVICAFVDTSDTPYVDANSNAHVTSYGPGAAADTGNPIPGTFTVTGLDTNDEVVVEMWLVLKSTAPVKANSNVQSILDMPNMGNQTIPLNINGTFQPKPKPDVSIAKSDSPDPVDVGSNLTYTLTVTNGDQVPAPDTVVQDTLDANTSYVTATATQGTCSQNAGVVTCNLGTLAKSQVVTVTIVVKVLATAPNNDTSNNPENPPAAAAGCGPANQIDLCNSASVDATGMPSKHWAYQPTNVKPGPSTPAIGLDKSTTTTVITATGQVVHYTFVVSNQGNVPLTNVQLTDSLCTAGLTGPTESGTINSVLDVGEHWTYTCDHTVTAAEFSGSTLVNNASVTAKYQGQTVGPATDSVTIPIQHGFAPALGHVTVVKNLVGAVAGAPTAFTFHVSCPAVQYAADLTVDAASATHSGSTPDALPVGTTCTVTETSTDAHWTLTSVTPAAAGSTVMGTATAQSVDSAGNTVTFVNTRATGVITVTKTRVGAPAGASTDFAFELTCPAYITATGPAYPWAQQTLTVHASASAVASATSQPIPTGVVCTVAEVPTSGWQQTTPAGGGDVTVTAPATAAFTNTRNAGALQLVKSVHTLAGPNHKVGSFVAGELDNTLVYTLTLSEAEPAQLDHTGVVVSDYLPGYGPKAGAITTTYVKGSATCSTGCAVTYEDATHELNWAVGGFHAGDAPVVMTFEVTIDAPTPAANGAIPAGQVANVGWVESNQQADVPSNTVKTPIIEVLGEKRVRPSPLPYTGADVPIPNAVTVGFLLLGVGVALTTAARRRRVG